MENFVDNLIILLPEVFVAVMAMFCLMIGAFKGNNSIKLVNYIVLFSLIGSIVIIIAEGHGEMNAFNNSFIVDSFAMLMKILCILGAIFALVMSIDFFNKEEASIFEYPILLLLATLGMMMMVSANSLISMYIGIELQSLALYVMAAFKRDSVKSSEAGLKYFVLGALSSGMLLYGCSLIYGFTGATEFTVISEGINSVSNNVGLMFGIIFICVGLAFKVSAVPFHMWTPDVYEGAPTPVTAFFAAAPKIAAIAVFIRIMMVAFVDISEQWQQIIIFISIASMLLGSFAAIGQSNVKRLLAYSSIGHIGFALMGLAAAGSIESKLIEDSGVVTEVASNISEHGIQSVIIYITIYMIMTIGSFAFVVSMRRGNDTVEDINDLAGLSQTQPIHAFFIAIIMFSLAGIPPLAGFFAKFYVFEAAVSAGLWPLALVGGISSVIGAFYYLRICKIMYFDDPVDELSSVAPELGFLIVVSGVFVIAFFVYPSMLSDIAQVAAASLT